MNPREYDFDRFVGEVKNLDLNEILAHLEVEIRQTERATGPYVRGGRSGENLVLWNTSTY